MHGLTKPSGPTSLSLPLQVQDIERLNGVWSTDSMFSKPSLKIPFSSHSNESSHANTPRDSPVLRPRNMAATSSEGVSAGLANGLSRHSAAPDPGQDEEVRSKPRGRRQRAESSTASCGEDGVKSIMDILSCADVQLQASRDFAEKLAKRR